MQWNPNITLADMIISEGLAESFAAMMFGADKIDIWVKNTSPETLKNTIKPAIKANLQECDFNRLSAFLVMLCNLSGASRCNDASHSDKTLFKKISCASITFSKISPL
jgi:uncharacterized protein YjaZ